MKCIICNSEDIREESVMEEFQNGNDVVLLPIRTLVCASCGERYYNKKVVQELEEIRRKIAAKELPMKEIGKVMMAG